TGVTAVTFRSDGVYRQMPMAGDSLTVEFGIIGGGKCKRLFRLLSRFNDIGIGLGRLLEPSAGRIWFPPRWRGTSSWRASRRREVLPVLPARRGCRAVPATQPSPNSPRWAGSSS